MVDEVNMGNRVHFQKSSYAHMAEKKSDSVLIFFNEKYFLWLSLLIHQVTYSIAIHISSNCQLVLHGNYVLIISGFLLLEDGLSSVNNNHLSKTSFLLNTGSCIQETKEYIKSPEL